MKTRIAIMGGGIGSLAAAFELTEHLPKDTYDIQIYQMGWRLGGKCASSRNPDENYRNEEHGLHVLAGFYHNTFDMLYRVYDAWEGLNVSDFRNIDDSFLDMNGATLFEQTRGLWGFGSKWRKIQVNFPAAGDKKPGVDPPEIDGDLLVRQLLRWARALAAELNPFDLDLSWTDRNGNDRSGNINDQDFDRLEAAFDKDNSVGWLSSFFDNEAASMIENCTSCAEASKDADEVRAGAFSDGLKLDLQKLPAGIKGSPVDSMALVIQALVMARGFVKDNLIENGFDSINHLEFKEWLKKHGAPAWVRESIFVEFGYHYAFSYKDGDPTKGNAAAGATLRVLARMLLTAHGPFFRHFNGGIGEVLIKPLYDVLKARGVTFNFFHQVMSVEPSSDGHSIERIHIRRQAMLKDEDAGYEPFIDCPGKTGPYRAWPHKPLANQITKAPNQTKLPKDFEDPDDLSASEDYIRLHADEDFDIAILGIPAEALKTICAPLAAMNTSWEKMLSNIHSCPTLGVQLWTHKTTEELGWNGGYKITTGHVLPLSSWADTTHHLKFESASSLHVGQYQLCGPYPKGRGEHARRDTEDWLRKHFKDVLKKWKSPSRLPNADLYVQLNNKPSDLYHFSPAGSIEHRMTADGSEFDNLFLTGDWLKNGSDVGWVDGAIMSARQCTRAITGEHIHVYGETDFG